MAVIDATKIANRAIQRVGGVLIADGLLLTEDSPNAKQVRACYDIVRRAELRRNVWRFSIREAALRPLSNYTSKLVTFGAWAAMTAYAINDVVTGSDGIVYFSKTAANTGNDPASGSANWTQYFGPLSATEFVTDWSATPTYAIGDHAIGSDGTIYTAIAANANFDPVSNPAKWTASTTVDENDPTVETDLSFYAGEIVYIGNHAYLSKVNQNDDLPTVTTTWLRLATDPTLAKANFIYPIAAGPANDIATRDVYRLPNGYMMFAPQNPKQGSQMWLGAPSALDYSDWDFEGDYFTSVQNDVIRFRFVADIADPMAFDPMFIEGFASRIAFEICEVITQSTTKLQGIASEYKQFMGDARMKNGIETGPTELPEDVYITCRR